MMAGAPRAAADVYIATLAAERDENGCRLAGDCAGAVCPSETSTSTEAATAATTWLFVRVHPSERMTMPDRPGRRRGSSPGEAIT
jgi:hypothetical protein